LFTGRRLDILDGGSLKIYYYRNRYYDPHTGRFLTHDPLGITPNGELAANRFEAQAQYANGLNVYEYVRSMPLTRRDPFGLWHYDDPPQVRKTKARAWVLPDEDEAVYDVDGLASFVRLEPKEFGKWAKYKQDKNKCGWEVPNKAYVNRGDINFRPKITPNWRGIRHTLFGWLIEEELQDIEAHFHRFGYMTVRENSLTDSIIAEQFADPDIIAWAFGGHGAIGRLAMTFDDYYMANPRGVSSSGEFLYLHHRLAEVILYTCGGRQESSKWSLFVSSYGWLYANYGGINVLWIDWEDLDTYDKP